MAQPADRRLRAARRSGLTSPEPVRTPTAPRPPRPRPRARNPGQAAQQASGRTPTPRFTPENSSWRNQAANDPTESSVDRGLVSALLAKFRHPIQGVGPRLFLRDQGDDPVVAGRFLVDDPIGGTVRSGGRGTADPGICDHQQRDSNDHRRQGHAYGGYPAPHCRPRRRCDLPSRPSLPRSLFVRLQRDGLNAVYEYLRLPFGLLSMTGLYSN